MPYQRLTSNLLQSDQGKSKHPYRVTKSGHDAYELPLQFLTNWCLSRCDLHHQWSEMISVCRLFILNVPKHNISYFTWMYDKLSPITYNTYHSHTMHINNSYIYHLRFLKSIIYIYIYIYIYLKFIFIIKFNLTNFIT